MSFDHRLLWNTRFVAARLRRDELSEAAVFRYFLAVMAFDWLQFTLIAVTPAAEVSAARTANAWLTFGITLLGLAGLHACNGGARGRDFLRRYFPLSVTVGWKFAAALFAFNAALGAVPAGLAVPGTLAWTSVAAAALLNVAMFGCIGKTLKKLASDDTMLFIAGVKTHNAAYATHTKAES